MKTIECKNCKKKSVVFSNASLFCSKDCQKESYKKSGKAKALYERANLKQQQKRWETYEKGKTKCLVCGAWTIAPAMHAYQKHKITARGYKDSFEIPYGKGLIPEGLKAVKKKHVFVNGTIENLQKGEKQRYKKGDSRCLDGYRRRKQLGQAR